MPKALVWPSQGTKAPSEFGSEDSSWLGIATARSSGLMAPSASSRAGSERSREPSGRRVLFIVRPLMLRIALSISLVVPENPGSSSSSPSCASEDGIKERANSRISLYSSASVRGSTNKPYPGPRAICTSHRVMPPAPTSSTVVDWPLASSLTSRRGDATKSSCFPCSYVADECDAILIRQDHLGSGANFGERLS